MSRIIALLAAVGVAGAMATTASAAPLGARTAATAAPATMKIDASASKKITKKKKRRIHSCPY